MIKPRDFSVLRGRLVGISDRMLDDHLRLYAGYCDRLSKLDKLRRNARQDVLAADPLLDRKIASLRLVPDGRLQVALEDISREAKTAGIQFWPRFYLGEDAFWTTDRATSVNIPWYLAGDVTWKLVNPRAGKYTDDDVRRSLRHEFGHALGYALELWKLAAWREAFGEFETPYGDDYGADPTSQEHVRYLHRTGERHYAQKHPDEDWAETFACWLDPDSRWRDVYAAGTGARAKLDLVEGWSRDGLLSQPPTNTAPGEPVPYTSIDATVRSFLDVHESPAAEGFAGAAEVYNAVRLHESYFEVLAGADGPREPGVGMRSLLGAGSLPGTRYGGVEGWLADLRAACSASSGWALTCWGKDGLRNFVVDGHDQGVPAGATIVLAVDCWEHAYASDYGIAKHLGVAAFFRNVDWAEVDRRVTGADVLL